VDKAPVCVILAGPNAQGIEIYGPSLLPEGVKLIGPQKFLGSPEGTASKPQTPLLNGWNHEQERQDKLYNNQSFAYETHYSDRATNQLILNDCQARGYEVNLYYFGVKSLTEAYATADNVRNLRGFPLLYHHNIERGYREGMRELERDLPRLDRVFFCDASGRELKFLAILDKAKGLRLQSIQQEKWYTQHFEGAVNTHYPHKQLSDYIDLKSDISFSIKLKM